MRDLTDRALDAATAAGASYADVRVERLERQVVSVKNGRPDGLLEREDHGVGVRVLVDGAWGFASSSTLDPRENGGGPPGTRRHTPREPPGTRGAGRPGRADPFDRQL